MDITDAARSSVAVEVDAASLRVRTGTGGIKPLTDSDRAEIERIMREKVLHTAEYPTITFRSTRVGGSPESFAVDGELTIMGMTNAVTVRGSIGNGGEVRARAAVVQTQWGIKPYSAFLGALKVADEVIIDIDVMLMPVD